MAYTTSDYKTFFCCIVPAESLRGINSDADGYSSPVTRRIVDWYIGAEDPGVCRLRLEGYLHRLP